MCVCAAAANEVYVQEGINRTAFQFCKLVQQQGRPLIGRCPIPHATSVVVNCLVASALLYFVVTYILLLSKLKGYRKQPYTFVQVGLVYNTLQVRLLAVRPFICPDSTLFFAGG